MDVDDGIEATASEVRGSVTLRVRVDPKPDEVVVESIREWTPTLQKDGNVPVSVRDIGIQADFGGASIACHQKYLRASRGRQKKKRLAKKRAMESEETPRPNPDTAATPPPILRQSGVLNPTSLPAPVAPVADNSRDRVTAPPAKVRKTETPSKKKVPWYQSRKDERKRLQALKCESAQTGSSTGAVATPRRKIQLKEPISCGSSRGPKVSSPKNKDLRITFVKATVVVPLEIYQASGGDQSSHRESCGRP